MGEIYIGDLDEGEGIVWDQCWKGEGVNRKGFGMDEAVIGPRSPGRSNNRRWIGSVICGHREICGSSHRGICGEAISSDSLSAGFRTLNLYKLLMMLVHAQIPL